MSSAFGVGCLGSGGRLGGCWRDARLLHRSIADYYYFGRLAVITLISHWVHVQCIHDDRDCEGVWGYLTRPTLQVVARGELIDTLANMITST